ncbi:MAG TPA: hypothetical protein VN903_17620 [Polyangia bacterium]|nr:hypothetical protein [Polyangia bacterium]
MTAISRLTVAEQLKAWRELGDEMVRIISAMSPEQAEDLLPDWFGPRLFDLQVDATPPDAEETR